VKAPMAVKDNPGNEKRYSVQVYERSHSILAYLSKQSKHSISAIIEHIITSQPRAALLADLKAANIKKKRAGRPKQSFHS
jgi:hypothetical protein